jgi:PII-like signaling protein
MLIDYANSSRRYPGPDLYRESDRWEHRPLYEAIVLKAREMGMAGATVLRGPMGFGKSSILHTAKILRLSMDLPVVIELVDTEEKARDFLAALGPMVGGGLVTTEQLKVIHYEADRRQPLDLKACLSPALRGAKAGSSRSRR